MPNFDPQWDGQAAHAAPHPLTWIKLGDASATYFPICYPLWATGNYGFDIRRGANRLPEGVLHMGILEDLLAGGQRQKEYSDFVDRYEQGHPSQGYSDQEVLKRYGEVSHAVPSDQYAQAAQEALSKLSPEERAVFVKMLQDRAAARGVALPVNVTPEPKELGDVL